MEIKNLNNKLLSMSHYLKDQVQKNNTNNIIIKSQKSTIEKMQKNALLYEHLLKNKIKEKSNRNFHSPTFTNSKKIKKSILGDLNLSNNSTNKIYAESLNYTNNISKIKDSEIYNTSMINQNKKTNKKKDKNNYACDNILKNMKNVKLIEKDVWNDNNNLKESLINDDIEGKKEDESEMETIMDFKDERDKFLKKWIRIFNLMIKDYEIVDKEGKMLNGVDIKKIVKAIFEVKEKMEKMEVIKNSIKNKKLLKWYDQRKIISQYRIKQFRWKK